MVRPGMIRNAYVTKCYEMLRNVKNCYNSTNVLLGMKTILTPFRTLAGSFRTLAGSFRRLAGSCRVPRERIMPLASQYH
jgi:hypothetical protein